jgi:UDP-3-O-[3-hydroxymyristoyl] N-acetylglucosamine deacetylase
LSKLKVSDGKRFISISPSNNFSLNTTIDYPNTLIGKSDFFYTHSKQNFVDYLSQARTYALHEDIEKMRTSGQAIGGSLNNAIVVDKFKILNPGGLRFEKEFVKHKTLDCIGDLYLLGKPLLGSVECFAPGHKLNQKLVFKILNDKDNYKIEDSYVDVSYDAYTNVLNKDSLSPNLINVA